MPALQESDTARTFRCMKASQRLAVPKGTLANWVAVAKRGAPAGAVPGSRTVAELEGRSDETEQGSRRSLYGARCAKKRQRTLLGSRCPVRANENATIRVVWSLIRYMTDFMFRLQYSQFSVVIYATFPCRPIPSVSTRPLRIRFPRS